MTDDKAENISADRDESLQQEDVVSRDPNAEAPAPETAASGAEDQQLSELMAAPADASPSAPEGAPEPKVDLEQQAIEAAAQAVAEGERALAAAEAALQETAPATPAAAPAPAARNHRELVLRVLLAVNVVAMIVVALLPAPAADPAPSAAPVGAEAARPVAPTTPQPAAPAMNEPWNQALRASERREWGAAVSILERYLDARQEMPPSERLSVLSALSFYASRDQDFARSRRYSQQAQALEQSHSLPADLVKEAAAAVELGDQESLRRIWARFLLQQRQIPSWLYHHVAQAYLELGDSYREDAAAGARSARLEALEAAAAQVRAEALEREDKR
ncbi:MAG: hypothetical protein ACON4Z_16935 [Planctomycetota bacterium]